MTVTLALIPASAVPPVAHFAVPGAGEMFLDEPQSCPAFPGLTFDGLAVAPDGRRHYLMVTIRPPGKPAVRAHLGPDPDTVAQHGLILVAALRSHRILLSDRVETPLYSRGWPPAGSRRPPSSTMPPKPAMSTLRPSLRPVSRRLRRF